MQKTAVFHKQRFETNISMLFVKYIFSFFQKILKNMLMKHIRKRKNVFRLSGGTEINVNNLNMRCKQKKKKKKEITKVATFNFRTQFKVVIKN